MTPKRPVGASNHRKPLRRRRRQQNQKDRAKQQGGELIRKIENELKRNKNKLKNNIKVIYFEENASSKVAETLSNETGVKLEVLVSRKNAFVQSYWTGSLP